MLSNIEKCSKSTAICGKKSQRENKGELTTAKKGNGELRRQALVNPRHLLDDRQREELQKQQTRRVEGKRVSAVGADLMH